MQESAEYLIIGAGPAGLQLGYFLKKSGRSYLILERGSEPGGFFVRFPRHRRLISINKVHTGCTDNETALRWDWNSLLSDDARMRFQNYSSRYFPAADVFRKYLCDFSEHFAIHVRYDVEVSSISKRGDRFVVKDHRGRTYSSKRLVMATGVSKPYVPEIPGIELAELYEDVSIDPADFVNQRVLIIGKGNSGFETADNLVETAAAIHLVSPHSITMAWKSHFVGHLRAVNNNILDTYQLKLQNAILDASVERIVRKDGQFVVSLRYTHASGECEELRYDRVIVCAGFRFDASLFDESCRPELTLNERFPSLTGEWESTNIEGLFFIGTLMQTRDFKKTQSGFVHGFRYNIRALARIFEKKFHGAELPHRLMERTPERLTHAVIDEVNRSSALWQQPGFLADVIVVPSQGGEARYYDALPVDYVLEGELGREPHYYIVTLEYGEAPSGDPFDAPRIERHDVAHANRSRFLHPVVRRFSGQAICSEHHVIEDLAAEWREDVHIDPLLKYFEADVPRRHVFPPAGVAGEVGRACGDGGRR